MTSISPRSWTSYSSSVRCSLRLEYLSADGPISTPRRSAPRSIGTPIIEIRDVLMASIGTAFLERELFPVHVPDRISTSPRVRYPCRNPHEAQTRTCAGRGTIQMLLEAGYVPEFAEREVHNWT